MAELLLLNPIGARHMAKKHRKHHGGRSHSFHKPLSLLAPAAVGAAGALVVNALVNYGPIPDTMKQGNALYLTRAGLAILLGLFGSKVPMLGRYASDMAKGALIVTVTDFGKVQALAQGYNLSGMGYANAARIQRGTNPLLTRGTPNMNGMRGVRGAGNVSMLYRR